jgi:hypothetical protein
MPAPTIPRLNSDLNQIERMECDLRDKARAAFTRFGLGQNVFGVFSLDDLENKLESDLCQHIGVGIGFLKIEPANKDSTVQLNTGGGVATKMLHYFFSVIMAVPSGEQCSERHDATKVLTALRFDIMGSPVSGDATNRTWEFVHELPVPEQSSDTMLFYSQVWRLAMPNVGNRQPL